MNDEEFLSGAFEQIGKMYFKKMPDCSGFGKREVAMIKAAHLADMLRMASVTLNKTLSEFGND